MGRNDLTFNGNLLTGSDEISVTLAYASRCSLYVLFQKGYDINEDMTFDKLIIDINGKNSSMNACHFKIESTVSGYDGRLFFMTDIYDFNHLFSKKTEIVSLEKFAENLAIILSQKDKIKESFKIMLANYIYDIKAYKNLFDDLDEIIKDEPEDVRKAATELIINGLGKQFITHFFEKGHEMEKEIADFTKKEHEEHGFYLRKQALDIISCSEFMSRCNIKPRGFAGDAKTMNMIYENTCPGDSAFSKILFKISIGHPIAQAVRNRRLLAPKFLKETLQDFNIINTKKFNVFSIACGPARELHNILLTDNDFKTLHFTLLDQDSESLTEAASTITSIEKEKKHKVNVSYIQKSVRFMLHKNFIKEYGRFHFIYSMGLFDYLTPPVAKALIEKIYSLLEPNGRLLIGNYHLNHPDRYIFSYWHDWILYYRDEEEMIELLRDTSAEDISVVFEDTGCQMFLSARKPL